MKKTVYLHEEKKKLANISDNLENLTMKITIKLAKNVTQFYTFTL